MTEETKKKNIGGNISTLRRKCGLTQAQLAEKIHVSTDHIAHAESGYNGISLWLLLDICSVLHVTPNDLLAGAYLQVDAAEPHGRKSISLIGLSPDDRLLLEYFHHFMENRKKDDNKHENR